MSENLGIIRYLELPNFLVTKYKKVFHSKKWSYSVHRIEKIINFARERVNVDLLKMFFNMVAPEVINIKCSYHRCDEKCSKSIYLQDSVYLHSNIRLAIIIRYQLLSTWVWTYCQLLTKGRYLLIKFYSEKAIKLSTLSTLHYHQNIGVFEKN